MLRVLVVGLVLLAAVMFMLPRRIDVPAPATATVLPETVALPAVELTDQAGEPFSLSSLEGDFTLLFFGFTNCPDICPLTLQALAAAKAEIASRAPALVPEVVFVSVDSERDTSERIAEYLGHFDSEFIGATAADETLAPLLKTLGVTVHKMPVDGQYYNVVHNGTIYVLASDGRWLALFGGSSHAPATIAEDYLRIRRRFAG
jgi:protein SCO1/2